MHPLLKLVASQPQLLVDHAQAYAELMAAELPRTALRWKREALLKALALVGLLAALLLGGMALLLWAALPGPAMPQPWLLIVVPLLPATGAIGCLLAASTRAESPAQGSLQQQFSADLAMLRDATAP